MASATDVREWARQQGIAVPERGNIRKAVYAEYEAAHPAPDPGPAAVSSPAAGPGPGDDYYDLGVTEADFPPEEPPGQAERPPRPASRPKRGRGIERLFPRGKARAKKRAPRVPLADFAEGMWTDMAQVAPWPPLQRMLTVQAPYASVVFDDVIKGSFLDPILQPVARAERTLRALDGLMGPPVLVGMICATGRREQLEDGTPGDFDGRTKVLFGMLKYSLMQMSRIGDTRLEEMQAKSAEIQDRAAQAQAMIDFLFAGMLPVPAPAEEEAVARAKATMNGPAAGYAYPEPPRMDDTGADPGRM